MNMQQLFPHLGKVISGIGSRQFARLLHEMITASLPVDATHVIQGLGRSTSEVAGAHAVGAFGGNLHQVLNPGIDSRRLEPVMLSPTELADTRVDRSIRFESPRTTRRRRQVICTLMHLFHRYTSPTPAKGNMYCRFIDHPLPRHSPVRSAPGSRICPGWYCPS